ncbi:DMT family transporter [Spongorhabdus nitratireducens]
MFWKNETTTGVIAISLASFLWGTTGTAASFTPNVSPLATGAFAMGIAGLLLLFCARIALLEEINKLAARPKLLFSGALSIAIYPLAFYTSMNWAGVAIGTVVSLATAPFFSILLERLINKRPISLQWIISFGFGAIGVLLLTLGKQPDMALETDITLQYSGIILGGVAGLTYATYSWAARQMIDSGISSESSMAGMFGIAALILLPTLFFTGDDLFASTTNTVVVLYMAVIPMFTGYLLFSYGLQHLEASRATLITLLEPVVATFLAVIIVKEAFSAVGWFGMLFIAICLMLQTLKLPVISKACQREGKECAS